MGLSSVLALAASLHQASAVLMNTHAVNSSESDDPCKCMNWKELYDTGRVLCGEFGEMTKHEAKTDHTLQEISAVWAAHPEQMASKCTEFFEKLNSTACVPYWDKLEEEGAWCYVSDKCQDLDTGHAVSDKTIDAFVSLKRDVAGKTCQPQEFRLDRDYTTEQLYAFAKRNRINMADMVLNLYNLQWGQSWIVFGAQWNANNFTALHNKIVMDMPMVIAKGINTRQEMMILRRNQLWELYYAPKRCPETKYCLEKRPEEVTIPPGTEFHPLPRWAF